MGMVGIFRKSGEKSEKRWRKHVPVQKCQVIAEYKELVGSCADIPQSLELSRIIFFTAAACNSPNDVYPASSHSDGAETITFEVGIFLNLERSNGK